MKLFAVVFALALTASATTAFADDKFDGQYSGALIGACAVRSGIEVDVLVKNGMAHWQWGLTGGEASELVDEKGHVRLTTPANLSYGTAIVTVDFADSHGVASYEVQNKYHPCKSEGVLLTKH